VNKGVVSEGAPEARLRGGGGTGRWRISGQDRPCLAVGPQDQQFHCRPVSCGNECGCVGAGGRAGGRASFEKVVSTNKPKRTPRDNVCANNTLYLLEITQVHALTAMETGGGKCCEDLKDLSIRNTRFHFAHKHLCKCVCVGVCSRSQDNGRTLANTIKYTHTHTHATQACPRARLFGHFPRIKA
jgi:hypothetical protein